MGNCWHEEVSAKRGPDGYPQMCSCGMRSLNAIHEHIAEKNPNYYTKEGFWEVWEWAKEQCWWSAFCKDTCGVIQMRYPQSLCPVSGIITTSAIDYHTFPDILIQFLLDNIELWGEGECPNKDIHDFGCLSMIKGCKCNKDWKLKHPALVYAEGLEKGDPK